MSTSHHGGERQVDRDADRPRDRDVRPSRGEKPRSRKGSRRGVEAAHHPRSTAGSGRGAANDCPVSSTQLVEEISNRRADVKLRRSAVPEAGGRRTTAGEPGWPGAPGRRAAAGRGKHLQGAVFEPWTPQAEDRGEEVHGD